MPRFLLPDGWIVYDVYGSGPPLLLLHGALGTAQAHFGRIADRLAAQFQLILPDLPGHGGSSPRDFFPVDYYDRDALTFGRLIAHLGLTSVHVLGFSDGAMMGLVLAAEHPEHVRSLVAISGQAYIDEPTVAAVRAWLPPENLPDSWQRSLARLHGDPYWKTLTRAYVEGQERILIAGGEVVRRRLSRIRCPTLIMHGKDDPLIAVFHAEVIGGGIPGAKLLLYEKCGHNVLRERETEGLAAIIDFLTAQS